MQAYFHHGNHSYIDEFCDYSYNLYIQNVFEFHREHKSYNNHHQYMNLNISLDQRNKMGFMHIARRFEAKIRDQYNQKILVNIY